MRKVVIDANIVVSALMTPAGKPARILNMVSDGKLQLCYSTDILTEYMDVLSRPKFNFSDADIERFFAGVMRFGMLVNPTISNELFTDEKDRCYYDTAKTGAITLITGNIKHYPNEPLIMTPADFLASLEEAKTDRK